MKSIAHAVLLALGLCSATLTAFAEDLPPPISRKIYTLDEIYKELFSLKGNVVRIKYTPALPKQISETHYADNLNVATDPIYITFPQDIFGRYFKKKRQRPIYIFVLVDVGEVQNQFGAISEGPVLLAVGTSIAKDIRGNVTYK